MQTFAFPLNPTETNPFFLSIQFPHKDVLYTAAVCETVTGSGDSLDVYTVLLVYEQGTMAFEVRRDEEENWTADGAPILQEVVYVLGQAIDEELTRRGVWFERVKNM